MLVICYPVCYVGHICCHFSFLLLYLLRRLDGGESGRGGLEDTSDKGGDRDVLQCANGTSAHGLGGSGIVISLLDKTHIVLCGVSV